MAVWISVYVCAHMCVWYRLNDEMYFICVQGKGHACGWQGMSLCGLGNQGRLPGRITIE